MDDKKIRMLAKQRLEAKKGFQIHLLVYVLVNLFLFINNFRLESDEQSPVLFIALIWGIGIVVHGFATFIGNNSRNYEKRIEKEIHHITKD